MLTTTGSRLATAQMNGHMFFCNILGSIAPVDPPTVEQTAAYFGYAFEKRRVHRRCLVSPSGGMTLWSAIKIHTFATTNGPIPKNSRKWRSSFPGDPIGQPALFWMSSPTRRKSGHWVSHPLLFCFALINVKGRDRWRSKSKWREEGVGDHNDFVVRQRERVACKGGGEQAPSCEWAWQKACILFVSNKLKENVAIRYNTYLARERAIKGEDLVGVRNFSAVGLNPMKSLFCIFSHIQDRIRDPFYSIE